MGSDISFFLMSNCFKKQKKNNNSRHWNQSFLKKQIDLVRIWNSQVPLLKVRYSYENWALMSNLADKSNSRPLHITHFHNNLFAIKFMPVLVVYIFRLIMRHMLIAPQTRLILTSPTYGENRLESWLSFRPIRLSHSFLFFLWGLA